MLPEPSNLTTRHQTSRKAVKKIGLQSLYWAVGIGLLCVGSYVFNSSTSILTFGKHNEPTFFELSSEQVILPWQWLRPPRWYELTVAQPVVGYEAYNQQMQALLSIIVAKTGQPLYDLR